MRDLLGGQSQKQRLEHEAMHVQYIDNYHIYNDIIYNKVESKDLVYKLLSKLSPKRAKILRCYFFEGMTLLQISKKIKCTQSNIHYHYKKALKELHREYGHTTTASNS